MSQNHQAHFKNLTAYAARFLKSTWPFWYIIHEMINYEHVVTSEQVLILRYVWICKHEIVIPKMADNFCKRQEYFLFFRG